MGLLEAALTARVLVLNVHTARLGSEDEVDGTGLGVDVEGGGLGVSLAGHIHVVDFLARDHSKGASGATASVTSPTAAITATASTSTSITATTTAAISIDGHGEKRREKSDLVHDLVYWKIIGKSR